MIHYIEEVDRADSAQLLESYFRLRKKVFADELKWKVRVVGDLERDELDDQPCVYVIVTDNDNVLIAGARLIPTAQVTLLSMAFDGLVPHYANIVSPTTWESSRYCVDRNAARMRVKSGLRKSTAELSIGTIQYAKKNGIKEIIAVCEERLYALSKTIFPKAEEIGRMEIDDDIVICARWPVDEECIAVAELYRKLLDIETAT